MRERRPCGEEYRVEADDTMSATRDLAVNFVSLQEKILGLITFV